MFCVAVDNCVSSNMINVVSEYLLREQVDQSLDARGHLLWTVYLLRRLDQIGEVVRWICHLEALNVELVLKEYCVVVDHFLLAKVAPNLVSEEKNGLDDLLLSKLVVFVVFAVVTQGQLEAGIVYVCGWICVQLLLFIVGVASTGH